MESEALILEKLQTLETAVNSIDVCDIPLYEIQQINTTLQRILIEVEIVAVCIVVAWLYSWIHRVCKKRRSCDNG